MANYSSVTNYDFNIILTGNYCWNDIKHQCINTGQTEILNYMQMFWWSPNHCEKISHLCTQTILCGLHDHFIMMWNSHNRQNSKDDFTDVLIKRPLRLQGQHKTLRSACTLCKYIQRACMQLSHDKTLQLVLSTKISWHTLHIQRACMYSYPMIELGNCWVVTRH